MGEMRTNTGTNMTYHNQHNTEQAVRYLSAGLSVFPLAENSKRPTQSWEQYQQRRADRSAAEAWQAGNLGIVTGQISGVVVVDCESEENALWFMTYRSAGLLPGMVKTPRGIHLYYQHTGETVKNATHIRDGAGVSRYDIRGDGGYVVAPPSTVKGKRYRWLREFESPADLPYFRPDWRPEQVTPQKAPITSNPPGKRPLPSVTGKEIKDGAAYIQNISAHSGQGGHADTWRAANRLRDSGLSESEALDTLREWNQTNAHPPWSDRELAWKIKDCYSR